jgi:hypothetical protein
MERESRIWELGVRINARKEQGDGDKERKESKNRSEWRVGERDYS